MRVAITGNMGSGKSSLAAMLVESGGKLVDADRCARELLESDAALRTSLAAAFGEDLLDDAGQLNRSQLAARAFRDETSGQLLNRLMRDPLERKLRDAIEVAGRAGGVVVFDAPLLFEWGIEKEFDLVVVVRCSPEVAMERLRLRGVDPDQARRRRQQQIPAARQADLADVVVDNDGDVADLRKHAQAIWKRLQSGDQQGDG